MIGLVERFGMAAMRCLDPETAHAVALQALWTPLAPLPGPVTSDRLRCALAGLDLPNPVGLAAGFDKNAVAVGPLMRAGFGWIEVGAATPLPQPGNPRPRLFRLSEDAAAINRFGFNNDGAATIVARLSARPSGVPVGLNIGANKTSPDRAADFGKVLRVARDHVDFATVNVSSPNTERLRDLQGPAALTALLEDVMQQAGGLPVLLKISPDLDDADLADIAKVAEQSRLAGIIATNTTLARDGLRSRHASETGGLSGRPLFERSTRVLARLSTLTRLPLVGVGGVASGADALTKIRAGASAVQLYTGLVYGGLSLGARIARDLDGLLAQHGFQSVAEAVGTDRDRWL